MKKAYIAPVVSFEQVESDTELMTVSNPGIANGIVGGVDGETHLEENTISGTGENADDEWGSVGAKSSGFYDSWEEEMW